MYGQITKVRPEIGAGVIRAEDGSTYRFTISEIKNAAEEIVGHDVDFVLSERRPRDIIVLTGTPWTAFGDIRRPN